MLNIYYQLHVYLLKLRFSYHQFNYNILAFADKYMENNFNFKHSFLSEFNSASEQAGKLELGKNKTVICFYRNYQVCIKFIKLLIKV